MKQWSRVELAYTVRLEVPVYKQVYKYIRITSYLLHSPETQNFQMLFKSN